GRDEPVHAGHLDVHEHDIDGLLAQERERPRSVAGLTSDLEILLRAEQHRPALPLPRRIVDEQHTNGRPRNGRGHSAPSFTPSTPLLRNSGKIAVIVNPTPGVTMALSIPP